MGGARHTRGRLLPLSGEGPIARLEDSALRELLDRVASAEATPGAGPVAAWTCALAAGLVEMVCAVGLGADPGDPGVVRARGERARTLRDAALELAERDAAAYHAVLELGRRRAEPGHLTRLRAALSQAADPPLEIAAVAAEVTALAADSAQAARGGVRGEAIAAAVLGEAVVRACGSLVVLNLGGAPQDARLDRVRELAREAAAQSSRAGSQSA